MGRGPEGVKRAFFAKNHHPSVGVSARARVVVYANCPQLINLNT